MADLGAATRLIASETAFGTLNHIDEGYDPAAGDDAPGWVLMETDTTGSLTERAVGGLHQDILSMNRSEREGRPS